MSHCPKHSCTVKYRHCASPAISFKLYTFVQLDELIHVFFIASLSSPVKMSHSVAPIPHGWPFCCTKWTGACRPRGGVMTVLNADSGGFPYRHVEKSSHSFLKTLIFRLERAAPNCLGHCSTGTFHHEDYCRGSIGNVHECSSTGGARGIRRPRRGA